MKLNKIIWVLSTVIIVMFFLRLEEGGKNNKEELPISAFKQQKVVDVKVENDDRPLQLNKQQQQIPEYLLMNDWQIKIHAVGLTPEGNMDTVDSATDIAWYKGGYIDGNIILAGHRYFDGEKGVFFGLEDMHVEEIGIRFRDGTIKKYALQSVNSYLVEEIPSNVMQLDGEHRVTLITCDGQYNPLTTDNSHRAVAIYK